ncbi:MAG: phosphomannomutase/phosphoglucomutase [Rhodospirillales bacterium]|nr:phosphomannomutase/phosphoglucomutase [Rhodospirillales bacterium]
MTIAASMDLHPTIFREYDIRGIVGETLTVEGVHRIGRAFGSSVAEAGGASVAVGYDGRLTSPELERVLVDGLISSGMTVHRVGRGPTPMLYFSARHLGADAGMMITGSHNPPEYNGIKMVLMGRPFFGEDILKLGRRAERGPFVRGEGRAQQRAVEADYVRRLLADYEPGRELSVAWDPGNGAAGDAVRRMCADLPGRHVLINDEVDGRFPAHHPDPTVVENLEQLQETVVASRCDLGIAFDGDGDRIGVVDAAGRVLWGDQLLLILARPILAEIPGAIVITDVKASQVFFDEIARMGGKPLMCRTGHSPIKTMMAETGAPLAGEMSGHMFFAHRYYGYDDALYAAVRLLSIVAGSDRSLGEMRDALPQMINTPEIRIDCPDERKRSVIDEVKGRLGEASGVDVKTIDGVRVSSPDGWWLLRASNTQPVLVGRCEAATSDALARQIAQLSDQLLQSGIQPPTIAAV